MQNSEKLFQEAQTVIPGGVNSPVRAFRGVGGTPIFFQSGKGAHVWDVDGKRYIDYVGSWGPLILGHAYPKVIDAVREALPFGMSFGAPTERETRLAKKIQAFFPAIEKVRMTSSGTEATMTAIRLARGITGRDKFIKFNGCYHGHSDSLLVKAGSGLLTLGIPATPGIPASLAEHTLVAEFNDLAGTAALFQEYGKDIAGIIVEPIAGNMGFVLPSADFLPGLRTLCDEYGALLIFDEVMTGFRVAKGGAQALYNITPDLTTLGKVIGGGMPVGCIGGLARHMDYLAPLGPVYQAGTLSGNPLAMAAGIATLEALEEPGVYERLAAQTQKLVTGLRGVCQKLAIPFQADAIGGMFGFGFAANAPRNYHDIAEGDSTLFKTFYHGMLEEGVYWAPSMFEAGFVSLAHSDEDIEYTVAACERVLGRI